MSLRWGSASRRLCLGADSLVCRSPVTSSWADGVGLVHVDSVDSREPHRPPVRWGSPGRLTRFVGIASAPGDMAVPAWWPRPSASGMTGPRPFPWRRVRCGSHTTMPPIYSVPINILITKHGILRAIGKRHTDRKRMECTNERNPRLCHEHRLGTSGRNDRGTSRITRHTGTMKEEADKRTERREGESSDRVYGEERDDTVATPGAGPARQRVKAPTNPIMPPLPRRSL